MIGDEMSRTKAHRPLPVRMLDPKDKDVSYVEHHNHANGECNLPPLDPTILMQQHLTVSVINNDCYYEFRYMGHNICGCYMCTEKFERKEDRRKKRHNTKRHLHQMIHDGELEEELKDSQDD
jgi:hypothetical protein